MPATRRLAAILAADVAGYSRLIGADEEGTLERLRNIRSELIDPSIAAHNGRIVKTTGDGFLAEFGSTVDALRSAQEIQASVPQCNAAFAPEGRIDFRIGVHQGDIVIEDGDIFGDGVNIAARLEGLAEPGGICVSARVQEDATGKLDLVFRDLGEQRLKNIARSVRAYAVGAGELPGSGPHRRTGVAYAVTAVGAVVVIALGVVAWWAWPQRALSPAPVEVPTATSAPAPGTTEVKPVPRLSIVVLPFANLSNDPEQQYFADGITDDLTTDLSRIEYSFVISRSTAFTYKDKPVNAKQIGRELGVRYVLEGSVQRSGKRVRVNAELIDVGTDAHVWAERFERDIGDLFALQSEVTSRIAVSLNLALIGAEATRPTANPDALDYIFRGRAAVNKGDGPDNYAEAISLFERALALDPGSTEAQSRLAMALTGRVISGMSDTETADIARAKDLVEQALAASPPSLLAHFAKGLLLREQRLPEEAIPEFEMVLAANPNAPGALFHLGWCKAMTGSIDEVIPLAEQAIRLSPRDPLTANFYLRIGWMHLLQSRIDDAIVWLVKARGVNSKIEATHAFLASAYGLNGETELAAAELAEARRLRGAGSYSSLARVKAKGYFGVPKVRALFEATYFVGLRKAGMPEE